MILDKNTLWADGLAHGGTVTELDLRSVRPGPGNKFKCFIQTSIAMAGATGFTIDDGAVSGSLTTSVTQVETLDGGALVEFELPSTILRYCKIELTGTTTAGVWTSGIILEGAQTNL